MYGKLTANKSNESLRTRLDSSLSDNEKRKSTSPRIESPIPQNSHAYYSWNLNSLFGKMNYLRSPIPTRMGIPNVASNGLGNIFKPNYFQKPMKLKATKIYDKFNIDDIQEMQLE